MGPRKFLGALFVLQIYALPGIAGLRKLNNKPFALPLVYTPLMWRTNRAKKETKDAARLHAPHPTSKHRDFELQRFQLLQ